MRYHPQSPDEVKEMLGEIGVSNIEELFASIPKEIRSEIQCDFQKGNSEQEVLDNFYRRALKNKSLLCVPSFLGAGAYNHYVPLVIDSLISRAEFYTAYTPYQPELAQGTLQAIYEYQTMISGLCGMDAANASLYDGASATAEAVLMAYRIKKGTKVLVAESLNPFYLETLKTYTKYLGFEIVKIKTGDNGRIDLEELKKLLNSEVSSVVVQSPNFYGVIEDVSLINKTISGQKPILITIVSEALSLAILEPPGKLGADIVAGEAHSFGIPIGFGGPALGFIATKKEYLRQIPGRIAGETKDKDGRRGFVLTLTTREQHIRREKATSNICTNQGLCMLMATIYLSLMGRKGLKKLAEINLAKGEYLKKKLSEKGITPYFSAPTFNEILFKFNGNFGTLKKKLSEKGIEGGLRTEKPNDGYLLAVTELTREEDIDKLAEILGDSK
ncbi:MAG: aminomethyl-transferring glycine dehydrogenase subunit GcvPA [Acidobacteriota bacterium]